MNELIKVVESTVGSEVISTVNARDLHVFLESKQDFSTWIKARIEQYEFVENQDFTRLHRKMEANNATIIDYPNCAKSLALQGGDGERGERSSPSFCAA